MEDATTIIKQAFPGLTLGEVHTLLQQADIQTHPASTPLCREGRRGDAFYILLAGEADITASMPDGQTRHLANVSAGGFFGEMALIDDKPRTATVTTASHSTVAKLSKMAFLSLLSRQPQMVTAILKAVTANLRATDRLTIADLDRKNAELHRAFLDLKAAQSELVARERMARDLEIAAEVQQSLLPQEFPQVEGWSIQGCNVAAREVGGDYFDVIPLDASNIALVLADVADKSMQAALYMAVLRTLFMVEAKRGRSPRETMLAVHRGFCEASRHKETFATAFYGVLDFADSSFRYTRAGHELPMLLRARDARVEPLGGDGRFIGLVEDLDLEERETTFDPGDTLLIYSDGMPEALDAGGQIYGMDRFEHIARKYVRAGAGEICAKLLEDVARHQGETPAHDDVTLLVAQRLA